MTIRPTLGISVRVGIVSVLPVLLLSVVVHAAKPTSVTVVPQPKKITRKGNDLVIANRTIRITTASKNLKRHADRIAAEFKLATKTTVPKGGLDLLIKYGSAAQARNKTREQGEQGYTLVVAKAGNSAKVTIVGGDEAGAFYGICTLEQLIVKSGNKLLVPTVSIRDWPSIKRRGMVVKSNDVILNYLARLKFNYNLSHVGRQASPEFGKRHYMESCVLSGYRKSLVNLYDRSGAEGVKKKYKREYDAGIRSFTAMFDDIGLRKPKDMGTKHATITKIAYEYLKKLDPNIILTFCPSQYFGGAMPGSKNRAYHEAALKILPAGVEFFWSGKRIFSKEITTEMTAKYAALIRRKPFIFDNQPIRWAKNRPASPCTGRSPDLHTTISGLMANVNHEAKWTPNNRKAETVLVTVAMYCWNSEAYDPKTAWKTAEEFVMKRPNLWYPAGK